MNVTRNHLFLMFRCNPGGALAGMLLVRLSQHLYPNHEPAGLYSPGRVGVWTGVGRSSINPARQAALESPSMALSPVLLPP